MIIPSDSTTGPYPHVMVIGRARHGKDTVAGMLRVLDDNFERSAFADALKDHLAEWLARSVFELFPIDESVGFDKKFFLNAFKTDKQRFRPLLQWFGTDFIRAIDDEFWIKRLAKTTLDADPNVRHVITDARFPNEIETFNGRGFFIIKVERKIANISESTHASEAMIDSLPYHVKIKNDGSIGDLFNKVKDVYDLYLNEKA